VTHTRTPAGSFVSIALPPPGRAAYVWRLARRVDRGVAVEVGEGAIGRNVVVVFSASGAGRANIVYALTVGETPKAIQSITLRLTVTPR